MTNMDKNRLKNILALEMAGLLCFGNLLFCITRHSIIYFFALTGTVSLFKHRVAAYKNNTQLKAPLALYILAAAILNFVAICGIISELIF